MRATHRARFRRLAERPSWRRMAVHTWSAPKDPTIYALLEVDVSRALDHVARLRKATGAHVTLTHLVGKAAAVAIAARPDVNGYVRRGRQVVVRDSVDVFFMVAFDGGENLSGAKVDHADHKSTAEIAVELAARMAAVRDGTDPELRRAHRIFERVPDAARGALMRLTTFLSYDLGLDLRRLGVPYDGFGSCMITNVGTFGLPAALAPLVPFSRCPIILTLGAVIEKPVAVDGRVEVRPVLPIGATLDHRMLDGYQGGQLARRFSAVLADPDAELGVP